MWKLLRNLLLAGVLFAGVLKLLAWYEVGQDAQRITAALAPYAQVRYDSVSAGLDGSVTMNNLSFAVKHDAGAAQTYSAERVVFESPGVFWLLMHSLFDDPTLPARFGVSVQGLKIPPTPWLDPHWFNPLTMVPFETAGCAASEFSSADYRKMDVSPGETRQHADYRYDADTHTLDATLTLTAPGVSTISIDGELRPFDTKALQSLDALKKAHIEQLAFTYSDSGYLRKRNQFCAQRGSIAPTQFVDQHVAAVQAMLQLHGVEPGPELLKIYRHLVEAGGQASVLSLPSSNFAMGAWLNSTPEDKLRQLNVTARYGDTPPVMFRLNFPVQPVPAAENAEAIANTAAPAAVANPPATADMQAAIKPAVAPPAAAAPVLPAPSTPVTTAPKSTAAISVSPPAAPPVLPAPVPAAELQARSGNTAPTVPAAPPPARVPDAHPPSANGLEDFDRTAAKLAPPPKRTASPAPESLPSQPAPPAGSTLALVWKPTVERLPEAAPQRPDFDVVEFADLNNFRGRFVRLVEDGGKKVEGYIVSADEAEVQLRVSGRGAGAAQFAVPKARIQQIQLVHK